MNHTRTIRATNLASVGLAALGLLAACSHPGPGHGHGTLQGHVTAGPTCPVEPFPPDPRCADRPVTDLPVVAVNGPTRLTTSTDQDGFYTLDLPAGVTFTVTAGTGRTPPRCPTVTATVTAVETVTEDIRCDTGIR